MDAAGGRAMTATVIRFPRVPVRVEREGAAWLVLTVRGYGWIHPSRQAALADAAEIAAGFGVRVLETADLGEAG
jgi:hypothetical protein